MTYVIYISIYLGIIALFLPGLEKKGLIKTVPVKEIGMIIAAAAITTGLINVAINVANKMQITSATVYNKQIAESFDVQTPIGITILVTAVLTPIIEEFLFRFAAIGLIEKFTRNVPQQTAFCIITASVIFGAFHSVQIQKLYGMVCGLILGLLYCYEVTLSRDGIKLKENRNIVRPIIFHITVNTIGCITYFM